MPQTMPYYRRRCCHSASSSPNHHDLVVVADSWLYLGVLGQELHVPRWLKQLCQVLFYVEPFKKRFEDRGHELPEHPLGSERVRLFHCQEDVLAVLDSFTAKRMFWQFMATIFAGSHHFFRGFGSHGRSADQDATRDLESDLGCLEL